MKRVVTGVLLAFVLGSLGFLVWKESGAAGVPAAGVEPAGPPGAPAAQAAPRKVVAYYFHGHKRCNTCRAIQAQSQEALEGGFPEALMSGVLEFRDVDTEDPGNDHYVTDFGLAGSSLVLAEYRDGRLVRSRTLGKVWDLHADRPAFLEYVRAETRTWLEAP